MYVSVRDDILMICGYTRVDEGLKSLGLDAVELSVDRSYKVHALVPTPERPHLFIDRDEDVDELARQSREAGIKISALLMPNNFNAPDIDVEIAWTIRTVQVAAKLGIVAVRIDAMMHGEQEMPLEERQSLFAERIRRVLDATEGLPVELGIENHGFQGNDPDFLDGLLAKTGNPRLGMTLDTGNFYWAGHPLDRVYEILAHFAPVAKHTHVKNICYPEAMRNTQRELGYEYEQYVSPILDGDIDTDRVIAILKAGGYDRDLCIEDESFGKYGTEARQANLRAAAEYFKAHV